MARPEVSPSPAPPLLVMEDRYGWPAPFLSCKWRGREPITLDILEAELMLEGGVRVSAGLNQRYHLLGNSALALPLMPLAGGTAINLLFWSIPWLALGLAITSTNYNRRMRYWNAGLCTVCEYPRTDDAHVCPECGEKQVPPRTRMRPLPGPWFAALSSALAFGAVAIAAVGGPYPLSAKVPALHMAVRDADRDRLARRIEAGDDINGLWEPSDQRVPAMTPLMWAARLGNTSAMEQLLAAGATIEAKNRRGETAAFYALQSADGRAFSLLMDRGGAVTPTDLTGATLLHAAAYNGQPSAVRRLAAAGLDANQRDLNGDPPLFWAIIRPNAETLEALLQAGANPNAMVRDGTPLTRPTAALGLRSPRAERRFARPRPPIRDSGTRR